MVDFSLLSHPVQKSIWKMSWKEFTPIQELAIDKILTTDHHYILSSATASGKTEAAFLPILSLLDTKEKGVLVLYISPLRALINDQFFRIEELCRYLKIPVTKWHSDVMKSHKDKLLKNPKGILQITPESIEAFFFHHPDYITHLFHNLKFIIIDELHSFIGQNRGVQLQSLLERIRFRTGISPRVIGLSATLQDYSSGKAFMDQRRKTFVLKIEDRRPLKYYLMHIESAGEILPSLVKDIYQLTQKYRTLIFTNSRRRAEELAVKLKRKATALEGHQQYFSHHSSLAREEREHIERALREKETPLGVCCTSTLELGIDIGTMDLIMQLDSTYSVSSLIQRLGRSGRKKGTPRMLQVYTTDIWNLLQALACLELFREGFMDTEEERNYPLDILFQQILSILTETRGITKKNLLLELKNNRAFQMIPHEDIEELISSMIKTHFIQDLRVELILGVEGEKLLNSRRIYAAFDTLRNLVVFQGMIKLGNLPYSPLLKEGENILLGAKMWEIQELDLLKGKIFVKPSSDGRSPLFLGQLFFIHTTIREKMLSLLYTDKTFPYLNEGGIKALSSIRESFLEVPLQDLRKERPYFKTWSTYHLFTFTSSRINHTLLGALMTLNVKVTYNHGESSFIFKCEDPLVDLMERIQVLLKRPEDMVKGLPDSSYHLSNWATYLPRPLQIKWLINNYYDIPGTMDYLKEISFKGTFGHGPSEKKRITKA